MPGRALTVEGLLERATAGRELRPEELFKPSHAYRVLEDPYLLWCDFHAPPEEAVDETSRYEILRRKWGDEHEERWIAEHYPSRVEIRPLRGLAALRATLEAMLSGAPAIHSPELWDLAGGVYGAGDLLVRSDEAPSDLGPFHYRVRELKRSRRVKDYQVAQAVFYNCMLGRLQGYVPDRVGIVLEDEVAEVPAGPPATCERILADWRKIRAGEQRPETPGYDEASSPWRVWTNKVLERERDLTLFPGITGAGRRKMRERLGPLEVEDLAKLAEKDFQAALGPKVGLEVYYKYRAYATRKPFVVEGGRLEIPRRKRRLYFDFETCDGLHPTVPPHVYMIGCYDGERESFSVFTARGPGEEEKIFRDFLAWAGDLRDACLYHWTSYEIGQMRSVRERHPALRDGIDRTIAAAVDLKECVKKRVFFGTRSYSIKEVAPFLGFRWEQGKDVGAFESMVLYWEWLEDGDGSKIRKVETYNRDDCLAMAHVDRALADL